MSEADFELTEFFKKDVRDVLDFTETCSDFSPFGTGTKGSSGRQRRSVLPCHEHQDEHSRDSKRGFKFRNIRASDLPNRGTEVFASFAVV